MKSHAAAAADFQHSQKRVQGGERTWGPLCSRKAGRTGLQIAIFRSWCYEPNPCISSYLENHWSPSWWHLLLATSRSFLRLVETLWKDVCLMACIPASPRSHEYCSSSTTSLEQFLRAIWGAFSQAAALILPPIKLTHNSHVVHFLWVDICKAWFMSSEGILLFSSLHLYEWGKRQEKVKMEQKGENSGLTWMF